MIHSVIYSRSRHPVTGLIRFMDGVGPWGHCAGILPDGETVIEARAFHGVVVTPLVEVIRRSTDYRIVDREVADTAAGASWAESTIGAGYDWIGALSVPWRRDWQDDACWFCSEHVEVWLQQCGITRFSPEKRGIGPNLSYYVRP